MQGALLRLKTGMTVGLNVVLIVAVGLLVLDVVWGVFTRYVMGEQAKWTEELARFLLIWVTLLGGAVAFRGKEHLGVDFFVGKFHPKAQKVMVVITHLIVLFFAGAVLVYGGSCVVYGALSMEQMTPALGWKMGFVYLALPFSGLFVILYILENLIETLTCCESESQSPSPRKEVANG